VVESKTGQPVQQFEDGVTKSTLDNTLQSKKKVAVIYFNLMDIMSNMSCAIDRIRDTSVSSKSGLYPNLTDIVTNFYKDDALQPKPDPKLSLQKDHILKLLEQLRIENNSEA